MVCTLRSTGLIARLVLDGPINGEMFRAYAEQLLAPVLRPGGIVIMDNLGAHKVAGVRDAIEAGGATVCYLPPYSPDLNPFVQVFAKFKALLQRTAARTTHDIWSAIGTLLGHFPPEEGALYIRHADCDRLG